LHPSTPKNCHCFGGSNTVRAAEAVYCREIASPKPDCVRLDSQRQIPLEGDARGAAEILARITRSASLLRVICCQNLHHIALVPAFREGEPIAIHKADELPVVLDLVFQQVEGQVKLDVR
jgi:hypothetical protein